MSDENSTSGEHKPEFDASSGWAARYATGDTPWDQGRPHPELVAWVASLGSGDRGRALVPGCGRGHDAVFLAESGFDVTAVDFAEGLTDTLGPALAALGSRYVEADALAFDEGGFDLVFEHTFFCAIPPERRGDWGALVRRALRPGGRLAVLVFPADKPRSEGGPPHRTTLEDLSQALGLSTGPGGGFRVVEERPVATPIATRAWAERWALFERLNG